MNNSGAQELPKDSLRTDTNDERSADMPQPTEKTCSNLPLCITIADIVSKLTKSQRERIISEYDVKNLEGVFSDFDLMRTVDSFLGHGMNISETARNLYMHRNTLMYRLNKIRDETGLDLRKFDMAVTFEILRILYENKN